MAMPRSPRDPMYNCSFVVDTRVARSSPFIEGDFFARSTSSFASVEIDDSTPRITPRDRRCSTSARVSIPEITGTPLFGQEALRGLIRAPVARQRRKLAHRQSFYIRPRRLGVVLIRAVVADLRIRQHHDLPGIGRVGEDFLVSGDRGIEDHFARAFDGRTKTLSLEDRAVFQGEDCWVQWGVSSRLGGRLLYFTTLCC